jgi:Ca-activated chloride channel family protein
MLDLLRTVQWRFPAAFALLLCPLALAWLARRRRRRLLAYADAALHPWALAGATRAGGAGRIALSWLAWTLLAVALAGPRWPSAQRATDAPVAAPPHTVDVMVVLDVSASMRDADVAPDRATRARLELLDLVRRLHGERLGLVLAAGQAGLVLPPTEDTALFTELLPRVGPGVLNAPGSDLGAGLAVARRALTASPRGSRAVLLVSDAEQGDLAGAPGAAVRASLHALQQGGIPVFMLAVSARVAPHADAPRDPDHAGWARLLPAPGALADVADVADGDADWRRLYDEGIARLPSAAPPSGATQGWREGFRVPLWLALAAWLLLLSPRVGFRRASGAWLLVAALGAAGLPAPAQAGPATPLEQQAWVAWQAGHWDEAERLYGQVGGAQGALAAGAAALRRGDGAAGQRWSARALMLAADAGLRTDALSNLGHAYALQGCWNAAAEAWEAVLVLRPGDARASTDLAVARAELARRTRAPPVASDLRGRHGFVAQGLVQTDAGGSTAEPQDPQALGPHEASQDGTGARQDGDASAAASGFRLQPRDLASGLAKIGRVHDAREALLRGLVKQDRAGGTPGLQPW